MISAKKNNGGTRAYYSAVQSRYDLRHFVDAQDPVLDQVRAELRAGRKTTHWMWFVFPQIEGLGSSFMAARYALASLDHAKAYFAHPVLGPRLKECTQLVLQVDGRSIRQIFGQPDDMKFRSCMTLFAKAAPAEPLFAAAIGKHFGGEFDPLTLARLSARDG